MQQYLPILNQMREFTTQRNKNSIDELWCLQHSAVFTLGANADERHILKQTDIPVLQSDRGGQVTYHGPGQAVIYLLVDLKRKSLGIKRMVHSIEEAIIDLLKDYGITSEARTDAHGVYVDNAKIASLGLRVHNGCSYHGLALNIDMDLKPFSYINPCGLTDVPITQLKDNNIEESVQEVTDKLTSKLCSHLEYKNVY